MLAVVLLGSLGAACARGSPRHGPVWSPQPGVAPPPAAVVAPGGASDGAELTLPENPASVAFTELAPLSFRKGAPLALVPIAKGAKPIGLSPAGTSWVLEEGNASRLVTPSQPAGVVIDLWNSLSSYSIDGRYVAVWSYHGPFRVLDVATGQTLVAQELSTCGARFVGPREVLVQTASNDGDAKMLRVSLDTGTAVPFGGAPDAQNCHASLDGTRWMIEAYDARWFVDGRSGKRLKLPNDPAPGGSASEALSTAGDRRCTAGESGLSCVRYPEGTIEHVWSRPSSVAYVTFDPSGKRALFFFANDPDGVYDTPALVDFEARTVRPLKNARSYSGSMPALTHGGVLLTVGSGHGVHVYDLERGQERVASHRPLYGNFTFAHQPRVLIAGTDEPMDLFRVEVP